MCDAAWCTPCIPECLCSGGASTWGAITSARPLPFPFYLQHINARITLSVLYTYECAHSLPPMHQRQITICKRTATDRHHETLWLFTVKISRNIFLLTTKCVLYIEGRRHAIEQSWLDARPNATNDSRQITVGMKPGSSVFRRDFIALMFIKQQTVAPPCKNWWANDGNNLIEIIRWIFTWSITKTETINNDNFIP